MLNMRRLLVLLCFLSLAPLLVKPLNPSLNDDVLGLIVFKADVQDPKGKLASWDEDEDIACGWEGVKCNPRSNRVVELNLDGFSLSGHLGRGLLQLQSLRKLSLANNNLTGSINPNIARLDNLRVLDLSGNSLSGTIPDEFFQQCSSLRSISMADNKFSGKIPESLGSCSTLASVDLSFNQFSGSLPAGIWSLSALRMLDLSGNSLEGEIPEGIEGMKNLRALNLKGNRITGSIPGGIGSCLLLRSIDLSENSFSGSLPGTLQQLTLCHNLDLHGNALSGEIPESIGQIEALETLDLSANAFSGKLPSSLGNLVSLQVLNVSGNSLVGPLPVSLGSLKNLQVAGFSQNSFTGDLPHWIFKSSFQKLRALDLSSNSFSGQIQSDIGDFTGLQFLNMSNNSLTGPVPTSIGRLKTMDVLDLSDNWLNGSIPSEIAGATSLKELRLQRNELAGNIPASIEKCSSLTTLILSQNHLGGPIPSSMSKLGNLQIVDLSYNSLSGTLPKQLANLAHLITFNISHNQLQGQLPLGGFFNIISSSSVGGNPSLCGSPLNRSCPGVLPKPIVLNPNSTVDSTPGSLPPPLGHKRIILSISALIAIGAAAVIVIGVIAITVLNLRVRSISVSRSAAALTLSGAVDELFSGSPGTDANSGKLVMFSSMDPDFSTGAHALLNKDCELGRGGFGAVYRTVLRDGHPIAIKKLTVSSLVKSQDEFEREVRKLGKVRHSNLVALEGYYWTPSLQLLISEFVSGGSLYKHLHEASGGNANSSLSWNDRFNIILGTAKGLAHLHQMNIIHYNIKSSNVLLDSFSGEPKVADFGLARLLPMLDRYVLSSKIQSALGYMAPEFACRTVKITEKCDVYGFGVLALEIVTGKRPVEYMEDDVVVLCEMVRGALEEGRVEECVDKALNDSYPPEEAIPVMKLGLICTSQVPSNRPDMAEVVNILELIRCPSEGQEELV
ncbi:probable LRR receptor-like serine/threonine-protein kinase IRK [Punica granatum]|uniref:Protein kinase domain-containing protein n=2 Tax=Punica granatum TaxID=22663 RepID=A0A218WCR0_PUNGR|nr:probable LRR receptor-like serine/threonine-protein kinase IRK [Punica granatum]OWM69872.1 hypothetical protein CDL15_Pgr025721 [Punica granatum]PKI40581.1 hypothetical protein CRG98_038991 [Punica granatum]